MFHARSLQKQYDEREQNKIAKVQEERIKQAKAAYAKLQEAKRPPTPSGMCTTNQSRSTQTTRTLTLKRLSSRGTASNLTCINIAERGHDAPKHECAAGSAVSSNPLLSYDMLERGLEFGLVS